MNESEQKPPCCSAPTESGVKLSGGQPDAAWIEGLIETPGGKVPRVATTLTRADRLGAWKARWGIGRMSYRVEPGLYAVGKPAGQSEVFVTANYKMSFDRLRSQLGGRDGWILVLDTRGINVWCAAGKGTFGTDELVGRIKAAGLERVVSHRRLILPQLGATGVSAHEVRKRSGFKVLYGPIRAEDLPAFLDAGMQAAPEMRQVTFGIGERLVLVPVDLVISAKYLLLAAVCFLLLSGLGRDGYSFARLAAVGWRCVALLVTAYLAGAAGAPLLLPWLPGRAFALKGACLGVAISAALAALAWGGGWFENSLSAAAWLLLMPAVVSFMTMMFTGSTPYTSLSGVRLELRLAVPVQLLVAVVGIGLWLAGRFV